MQVVRGSTFSIGARVASARRARTRSGGGEIEGYPRQRITRRLQSIALLCCHQLHADAPDLVRYKRLIWEALRTFPLHPCWQSLSCTDKQIGRLTPHNRNTSSTGATRVFHGTQARHQFRRRKQPVSKRDSELPPRTIKFEFGFSIIIGTIGSRSNVRRWFSG